MVNFQRFCPNCNYGIEEAIGVISCHKCGIKYSVFDGNIIFSQDQEPSNSVLNRAINIYKGSQIMSDSQKSITQSFKRFNTDSTRNVPLRQSPIKDILLESLYLIKYSLFPILLVTLIFGLFLFIINYANINFLGGNEGLADSLGVNTSTDWNSLTDYFLNITLLTIVALLNIFDWVSLIFLVIGMSLAILLFEKAIYETNIDKISYNTVFRKFVRKLPKIFQFGVIYAFVNILLIKAPDFFFGLIFGDFTNNLFGIQFNLGNFGIITLLVSTFLFFPIWLLFNIMFFLAIPSIILSDTEKSEGIGYSEVLSRGHWRKIFTIHIVRILIFVVFIIILVYLETFLLYGNFNSLSNIPLYELIFDYRTIVGSQGGFLTYPYTFGIYVIFAGMQIIVFLEFHRRRIYDRGMRYNK